MGHDLEFYVSVVHDDESNYCIYSKTIKPQHEEEEENQDKKSTNYECGIWFTTLKDLCCRAIHNNLHHGSKSRVIIPKNAFEIPDVAQVEEDKSTNHNAIRLVDSTINKLFTQAAVNVKVLSLYFFSFANQDS
jgi:hypothetical protein